MIYNPVTIGGLTEGAITVEHLPTANVVITGSLNTSGDFNCATNIDCENLNANGNAVLNNAVDIYGLVTVRVGSGGMTLEADVTLTVTDNIVALGLPNADGAVGLLYQAPVSNIVTVSV